VRPAGIAGLPHDDDFDDTEKLVIDLYNVVVANGQFAGSGLPIAPHANLSDGLLDVEPAAFQNVPHALDFVVNK
jgi:hypothetical protein